MELLLLAALGGLLALDGTSVGQFMVSRPLVTGGITGWALGDPGLGLLVGAILELYLLVSFPTGGSRFPEGATATVVAVGTALGPGVAAVSAVGGVPGLPGVPGTSGAIPQGGVLPLAIAVGLLWGQVGGVSIGWLRQANGALVAGTGANRFSPERLSSVHVRSIGLDFARGALVTVIGLILGRGVVRVLGGAWPLAAPDSTALLLVGGAVSLGILLRDLGGVRRHPVWLAAGLMLGLLGARFL